MGFNSKEFAYADTKVRILGIELEGLRGLTYKKTQQKDFVYGQGNNPRAINRGQKAYEFVLMLLKSDFDTMTRAAQAAGYEDIIDVPGSLIDITCVYQKSEDDIGFQTAQLTNCEFTEYEDGMKAGDLFKEVSLPGKALLATIR